MPSFRKAMGGFQGQMELLLSTATQTAPNLSKFSSTVFGVNIARFHGATFSVFDQNGLSSARLSPKTDESRELSSEVSMIGSARAATSTLKNTDDENLDFGGYQPSCLSMPALNSSIQKRSVANFLLPSEKFVTQGNKTDMVGKEHPSCVSMDTISDQSFQQTRSFCNKDEKLRLNDEHKRNTSQAQDSPTDKTSAHSCSVIVSKGNNEGLVLEVQRLKEENLALREEIMKIESEKLTIEKEILEKELSFEPEAAKQATMDSREAQQIADKLASELLSVKQSLLLTEEKIESMKAVHQKEVELLKHMHVVEVEARDKQLQMERALVAENKSGMEALDQLVHKADELSSKIDQLHKNLVSEREAPPTEKLSLLANIGGTGSEHESSLLVLDKRSSEVCSQERKDLEVEREAMLAMKEQLSQADAALRKELQEHTLRMQKESEDMARQKRELEHARNIAAEIALEVENSQRELEMYKNVLSKNVMDAKPVYKQERSLHNDAAYLATRRLLDFDRKGEHLELSRRYELHRRPYSAADVTTSSLYGRELVSRVDLCQTEAPLRTELDEDICYLKSQEDFLIQAEMALQDMEWAPFN